MLHLDPVFQRTVGQRVKGALRHGASRHAPVGLLGELTHLAFRHVSCHDKDDVVRRIEALIEGERLGTVERLDIVGRAEQAAAVGVIGKARCTELLVEQKHRAHFLAAPLVQHGADLRLHVLVADLEVDHAVCLDLHQLGQLLLGKALGILGVLVGGPRVGGGCRRARRRSLSKELAGNRLVPRNIMCSRKCANPGWSFGVLGATDLVPEHVSGHRHTMVGHDHHLHAVGERELDGGAAAWTCAETAMARATGRQYQPQQGDADGTIGRAPV